MFDTLTDAFTTAQQWLFEEGVQPAMMAMGLAHFLEDGYGATAWFMLGLLQITFIALFIGTWQRMRPVEPLTDPATVRTDLLYTAIHRLGLFQLGLFFALEPCLDQLFGGLRSAGYGTFHLDAMVPGLSEQPLLSLLMYLVVYDLLNYGIHRLQHQSEWWWRLHALHHAQRQLTMWSDNRNHLLDDLIRDALLVLFGHALGVAPGQFVAIVAFTQLSESFQHANLRVWFGQVGERLWVSPRFHRLHHSIGIGHETADKQTLGGHNFGVLLPWWDMLFGTANFELRFDATGVPDQVAQGRDYGRGFWAQQWLGLKRLAGRA